MTDGGYDEWLAAIGDGEGYYLACPDGHGSLPPRRTCPHCGAMELEKTPLPESGTVETFSEIHVAGPDFASQTPYVTAIASFDAVRLTGVLRGVLDEDGPDPSVGMSVEVHTAENPDTGDTMVVFRPR
ncbi:nucleic-acid-binding protein containing a zn-ribbon [Halogeometricum borinquense DSM 11551]|uniref:Nucleic-acid-binding protein containing a zn-ribbon n=1 Tax=Halogeometricum borinquense (strain ATCC 700274 / DSM 11551 / JCM 10706 / KCTC 4070 / PR3) TaxID=469382 RepID=E4NRA2_HALBP|nr:OB-fold domain-containing protein [Halogeometricum borinquense]ADQ67943.1 predicted nucleic-acid-binding protein containing a Zn-ribbon [Halogeometricum borinquense DSM 11551]ELY24137.1 nucleic-acid-binding protein containing a zn-ribbon [Halogeometricum borinquense DSM 11551]